VQMLFKFRAGFVSSKYCSCVVLNGSVVDWWVSFNANVGDWDARSAILCPCLKICFNNIFVFNIFGTRSHWWTT